MKQANVPRKSPKKVWLNATFEYFTACFDKRPKEAEENIKKPTTRSMIMEIRKGMSTLIFRILL